MFVGNLRYLQIGKKKTFSMLRSFTDIGTYKNLHYLYYLSYLSYLYYLSYLSYLYYHYYFYYLYYHATKVC